MKKLKISKNIRLLFLLAALLFAAAVFAPATAKAKELTSGKCGSRVEYSFDSETGTLTISGKGDMADFDPNGKKSPFAENKKIEAVIVEDGVTGIGAWAFYDCYSLKSVSLGKDVKKVADAAFMGCINLKDLTMQEGVEQIGERAFEHCKALYTIDLPESVTSVGEYAFDNTGYYRKKSNWENNALYLGTVLITGRYNEAYLDSKRQGAKPYVSDVNQVYKTVSGMVTGNYTVKEGTTVIVDRAFFLCGMTGVTLPESLQKIGAKAFYGTKLSSVEIPAGITTLEASAFEQCKSLGSVKLPKNLMELKEKVFRDCTSLEKITFPKKLAAIGDGAFDGSGLKSVTIPKNVKGVGKEAFSDCESLKKVTIKSGVKAVGDKAFYNCKSLKSVTIPKSVSTIGTHAFGFEKSRVKEGFKIKGYKGSAAQEYAKKHGIKFVAVK